jgi:hypothetical protein
MPNPFTITTAADSVRLDSQGRGSTTFTVSNRSGQPRRGRARPVPSSPEQASWLSVDGEAERSFSPDGTQQYTVRVASPPGAPTGRYTFGLDVVSVENPDEEWSQGPKVAFEVAPSPAKKPFPWWIVVVAAAVLLVGGLIAWLMSRGDKPASQGDTVQTSDKPAPPVEPSAPPIGQTSGVTRKCYVVDVQVGANAFPHRACFTYKEGQPGCEVEYRYLKDLTQPPYDTKVLECTQQQAKFIGSHADGYWFEMEVNFGTLKGSFKDNANRSGELALSPE